MEMDFRSIPKFFVCRGEMFVESRSFFAFWDDKKKKKEKTFQDKAFSPDTSSELSLTLHEGNRNKFEVKRSRFVTSR